MRKIVCSALLLLISLAVLSAAASALKTIDTRELGRNLDFYGKIIVFEAEESELNSDLNNDSDKTDTIIRYYDLEKKEAFNTGIAGKNPVILDLYLAFESPEASQGKDLNADGDKNDTVIIYYSIQDKKIIDSAAVGRNPSMTKDAIIFSTPEAETGTDYNQDGDKEDNVIRYYIITTKEIINTKQAGINPSASKEHAIFEASEKELKEDLNKDKDMDDAVLRYYSFSTNKTSSIIAFGQMPSISKENIAAFTVLEEFTDDLNGDLDIEDEILMYYDIPSQKLVNTKVEGSGPRITGKKIAFTANNKIVFYDIEKSAFAQAEAYGKDPVIYDDKVAFSTHEFFTGDLNEDADNKDTIIQYAEDLPQIIASKPAAEDAAAETNETANKSEAVVIIEPAEQKNETLSKNISAANTTTAAKHEAKAEHKPLPFEQQQQKKAVPKNKAGAGFFAWLLVVLTIIIGAGLIIYAVIAHEKPKKSRL